MRRIFSSLFALVALVAMSPALPAGAAEAPAPGMAVQLWPEGEAGSMFVIVSVQLPEDAKLPATVRLPLPEGAQVSWAGEIVGEDPNTDIQREAKVVEGTGGKAVEIELQKARVAQYEAVTGPLQIGADGVKGTLEWVQSADAPKTSFSVRLPAGVGEVDIRPAPAIEPQTNSLGESLYTLPDRALKAGDAVTLDVAYSRNAAVPVSSTGGTGGSRDTLMYVLLGLAGAAGAAAVVAYRRSSAAQQD